MPEWRNGLARTLMALRGIPTLEEELASLKLRHHFARRHGIIVGLYSYGCFSPARIDRQTTIGRYCSFAATACVFNRNHGLDYIGTNAYLYNPRLGVVDEQNIPFEPCIIGDDVWIGHNAVVVPSARNIGRGAVIAAGAVVTQDIPPYAIAAGNPAKIVRYRFAPNTIEKIEQTAWWNMTPDEMRDALKAQPELFFRPHEALNSRG